jgi:hypothetical protein
MGKRLIGGISILSVLMSLSLTPAHSATKAGAKCTKVGIKSAVGNKTFTCIKSGKKLVWDKGISKTFTPWASSFDKSFLVKSAIDAADKYFGKVSPNSSYEISIDSAITATDESWIKKSLNYANGSFTNLKREKVKIVLATNHDWGRNTLKSQNIWVGDPLSPYPCSDGSRDAYCAEKNIILLVYSDVYGSNYLWDVGRKSTPAHELFHTVQNSLNSEANPNFVNGQEPLLPRWLIEGSANFYGYYVNEKLGLGTYQEGRNSQIENFSEYRTKTPLEAYSKFNNFNPYGIGQAATEYIIASVGFESLLNIFKFTGTESSFSAGFKKATGIELNDFYSKFEEARASMQIGS